MRSKMIMAILFMVMATGVASAVPAVTIEPTSGPNVAPDGTILPPAGSDAATSIGLGVKYSGFVAGNPFDQFVLDPNGVVVPGTDSSGGLPTGNDFEPIHWTPTSSDIGKIFTVNGKAETSSGKRHWIVTETAPAQPVPVSAGVLGGFVVTAAILSRKLRKEN